jgi:hypothetical protein
MKYYRKERNLGRGVSDLLPKDGAGEHRVVATLLRQVNFNGQLVLCVPHTRNLQLIMRRIGTYTKFSPNFKGTSLGKKIS